MIWDMQDHPKYHHIKYGTGYNFYMPWNVDASYCCVTFSLYTPRHQINTLFSLVSAYLGIYLTTTSNGNLVYAILVIKKCFFMFCRHVGLLL